MIVIAHSKFPLSSADAAAKAFAEVNKKFPLPDFVTRQGPYVIFKQGTGIQTVYIHEFPDDKAAQAIKAINEQLINYRKIPDYSASIETAMEAPDAIKMLG